ncbi:MAG: CPXCG motif-containing cysteine-rich protein [Myxococcota bacterium]|nr:CPXCG motif-containing cysteine-rich protein [Myxococcota bacterium]
MEKRYQCPYCWELIESWLEPIAGQQLLVEDCIVCCRPIELRFQFDEEGQLFDFSVRAENGGEWS